MGRNCKKVREIERRFFGQNEIIIIDSTKRGAGEVGTFVIVVLIEINIDKEIAVSYSKNECHIIGYSQQINVGNVEIENWGMHHFLNSECKFGNYLFICSYLYIKCLSNSDRLIKWKISILV